MAKLKPPVNDRDQKTGIPGSIVTLVEYGDYQCPYCARARPLIKRLLTEREIRFVFRNFPLQEIHPYAFISAVAAESSGKQRAFWAMHDLIFTNQQQLHKDLFIDFARQLNMDTLQFARDLQTTEVRLKVEDDFESGIYSGVNGTPSFFINGEKVLTYDGSYQSLLDAVDKVTST